MSLYYILYVNNVQSEIENKNFTASKTPPFLTMVAPLYERVEFNCNDCCLNGIIGA